MLSFLVQAWGDGMLRERAGLPAQEKKIHAARRVCSAARGRHLAVQVVDGHMRQRAIVPVDAAHNLVHHAAQPLRAHRTRLSRLVPFR